MKKNDDLPLAQFANKLIARAPAPAAAVKLEQNRSFSSLITLFQEYYRIENEKRNIASEIEELKEYVSCLISNLETEKLKREQLFEEFKESTLEEIQKLYQEQLKELTDETLHSFENAINAVNETAFNANQENEETLWSKKRRLSQQSAENRLSNPIPLCPDLYANIFFQ
uniref:Uncharacterized protein n=1 Tax=Panagrolaimus sp. JU765 TaxID=591449 RepID=A0AC34Q6B6_9BILA